MEALCSLVTTSSKSPDWEGGLCYKVMMMMVMMMMMMMMMMMLQGTGLPRPPRPPARLQGALLQAHRQPALLSEGEGKKVLIMSES